MMTLQRLKEENIYTLFQVTDETDERALKRRFYQLLRKYPNETHPEEFMYLQTVHQKLRQEIKNQHTTDRTRGPENVQRRTRTQTVEEPKEEPKEEQQEEQEDRETLLVQVDRYLQRRDITRALEVARRLETYYPNDPLIFRYVARALAEHAMLQKEEERKELTQRYERLLNEPSPLPYEKVYDLLRYFDYEPFLQGDGTTRRMQAYEQIETLSLTEAQYEEMAEQMEQDVLNDRIQTATYLDYIEIARRLADRHILFRTVYDVASVTYRVRTNTEEPVIQQDEIKNEPTRVATQYVLQIISFAVILSLFVTPIIGIPVAFYLYVKRIDMLEMLRTYASTIVSIVVLLFIVSTVLGFFL